MVKEIAQTIVAFGSLAAIGYGLSEIHKPLAPLVLGVILLTGVVYARTCK